VRHVVVGINFKPRGHKPPGQAQSVKNSADDKPGLERLSSYSLNPMVLSLEVFLRARTVSEIKRFFQRTSRVRRQTVQVSLIQVRIDVPIYQAQTFREFLNGCRPKFRGLLEDEVDVDSKSWPDEVFDEFGVIGIVNSAFSLLGHLQIVRCPQHDYESLDSIFSFHSIRSPWLSSQSLYAPAPGSSVEREPSRQYRGLWFHTMIPGLSLAPLLFKKSYLLVASTELLCYLLASELVLVTGSFITVNGVDPAWFYSSLAQVAATIVGLIGAVLGARIVDHIALMRSERRDLDVSVRQICQGISERIESFAEYKQFATAEIEQDKLALGQGFTTRRINRMLSLGGGSRSGTPWEVQIDEQMKELERNLVFINEWKARGLYQVLSGPISEGDLRFYAQNLRQYAENLPGQPDADQPKAMMLGDAAPINEIADKISRFNSRLLPRSFAFVFIILAWLSVTGILWPLAALPAFEAWRFSKSGLLVALALGLVGLVLYFGYQFTELKKLGNFQWRSRL
jgi:hypothetical protein